MVGQALLVGTDVDEGATGLPASTILDRVLRHLQQCTIGTIGTRRRRLSLPAINVVYRPLIRTLSRSSFIQSASSCLYQSSVSGVIPASLTLSSPL